MLEINSSWPILMLVRCHGRLYAWFAAWAGSRSLLLAHLDFCCVETWGLCCLRRAGALLHCSCLWSLAPWLLACGCEQCDEDGLLCLCWLWADMSSGAQLALAWHGGHMHQLLESTLTWCWRQLVSLLISEIYIFVIQSPKYINKISISIALAELFPVVCSKYLFGTVLQWQILQMSHKT